ncbi:MULTISPECIES: putative Fe-S cluster assembly protein SufT [Halomonas]|uniref:Fe-S cluster assembly protein SufT n=3 Tax=Halomonas TaxID=2745 RepID=A0AAU7KE33_9GAMM|nr:MULTISPECIES: putative Fe-S cluster assembly protein SufT [Halomonas]MBR9772316.1 putative Fe-S cluster assembly protein SufT [Gammaproteobacteria bacterium]KJZ04485.1 FeS assembly SUF system protein SufT [Halomonas sp. S2151]MAR73241.1 putative Fe-S cluster assembly protein SufT [Halomonas sp.]MBR9881040.1 putative Fe-S cluster assembly protein SufT [Gammaproteobacteria bacterium]MBS8269790.1 putative Fe-S cluster assembly protein SufT [Halomonas litopenaei]|tara:strand:- start:1677 stop:2249 length:573 start_codon:yes stop_codon:yes gene_type:complete
MSEHDQIAQLSKGQQLPLQRDVEVISIPFGKTVTLDEDSIVSVMQAKGSTLSVAYEGRLYLIEGSNLDAVGLEPMPRPTLDPEADDAAIEAFVWDQLRTCFDPEIPVNIVDLGLVYGCRIERLISGERIVTIRMTLTAPGCGMGDVIAADARNKILGAPQISKVHTEIVFDPPWSREMMSDEAKLELGMF